LSSVPGAAVGWCGLAGSGARQESTRRHQELESMGYAMKNGRLYDANNLTEVWPRNKPLPTQSWWMQVPK
jgi:hypothetical protein